MAKADQTAMRGFASIVGGNGNKRKFDPQQFQNNLEEMGYGIAQAQAMAMAIGNIVGGGNQRQDGGSGGVSLKDITGAMKDISEISGGSGKSGKGENMIIDTIKVLKELGVIGGSGKGEDREVGLAKVGVEREATQGNLAMAIMDRLQGQPQGGNAVLETISALKELGIVGQPQQSQQNSLLETITVLEKLGVIGKNKQGGGGLDETLNLIEKLKGTGLVGGGGLSFEQQLALEQVKLEFAKIGVQKDLETKRIEYDQTQHNNGTEALTGVINFLREERSNGNAPPGPEADGDAVKIHCSEQNGGCGKDFIIPAGQLSDVVTCIHCGTKWRRRAS